MIGVCRDVSNQCVLSVTVMPPTIAGRAHFGCAAWRGMLAAVERLPQSTTRHLASA